MRTIPVLPVLAALLAIAPLPASAQLSLLGQSSQDTTPPADPLDRLSQLPIDTALTLLRFAPDSSIYPPAAEQPFLDGVLPHAVRRFMQEPFDAQRLRHGLERGLARYDASFKSADATLTQWTAANQAGLEAPSRGDSRLPASDPRSSELHALARERDRLRQTRWAGEDRLRWFAALKADLDAPAPAELPDGGTPARDLARLRAGLRELIEADRALDPILARVRALHAEIQQLEAAGTDAARLAAAKREHQEKLAEAEPLKRVRNARLHSGLEPYADALARTQLAPESRACVAPLEALFKLYEMDADIKFKVVVLRMGARRELEKRAAARVRP